MEQKKALTRKFWWKAAIFYTIYIQSFNDSNGDGIGDIQGVIEKLDYIRELGVDVIWISPFYDSPMVDQGYDVADYKKINPKYGDLKIAEDFIKQAKNRGIKVIVDLVINHCSNKNEWFVKAQEGDPKYRDYFIWREGKGDDKLKPPNNWGNIFGGSAWTYDEKSKMFYFHMFAKEMPDLNWENEQMKQDYFEIIRFWNKRGVSGFRIDALSHISKPLDFPDYDSKDEFVVGEKHFNGPKLKEYVKEISSVIKENPEAVILAEMADESDGDG